MSRNKDIKYLHTVTGWSYKDCRAKLKQAHWNLSGVPWIALKGCTDQLTIAYNRLKPVIADTCEALGNMFCSMADSLREVRE